MSLTLIAGSRINFVKIRACFSFHKSVPLLALLFIRREKKKVMMEKSDLNSVFGLFFVVAVAENSS